MKITICVNTGNSSFEDDFTYEMNRLIESLVDIIPESEPTSVTRKSVRDINGNVIWYIEVSNEEYKS